MMLVAAGATDNGARVQQLVLQYPVRCRDAAQGRLRRTVRLHSRRLQRLRRIHRRTQVSALSNFPLQAESQYIRGGSKK